MSQINEIDRQAAQWAAQSDGQMLDAERQAALDTWLAADMRHLGAYVKAMAVLAQVERSRAGGLPFEISQRRPPLLMTRRGLMLTGSVAASVAALGLVADFGWQYLAEVTYATNLGETKVVALADGSIVTLNTDSKITVRYTADRRNITLARGEALFDVAKNPERPFIVEARDMQVRAVGTSFAVRLLPDQPVQVLVREGVVEIKRPDAPAPILLRANARAMAASNSIRTAAVAPAAVARDLIWRLGRISFDDETLAAAAREFARYSNTRIVIDDPQIAARTVTGLYVSNDPVGFARAVAASLDLHAEVRDNEVRLTRDKG
jgi:transmembrane sensor